LKTIPILNIKQFKQEESLQDFYCNDLSKHLEKNKAIVHKPHKHNFFLCVIFTSGTGKHEIDFNTYAIKTGSVFYLKPGQTHYWTFNSTPQGYIFFHSQDFYEFYFANKKVTHFPFYYSYKNPPHIILNTDTLFTIQLKFKELYLEYSQKKEYAKEKIISLIDMLYIDLTRIYTKSTPSETVITPSYLKTLRQLEQNIEFHYKESKSAAFYANILSITPKHLNRITKSTLNKTTTELIIERVLLEAKRLIVHSNNSLSSIAELLGYEDYAYFSKTFKKHTQITPIQFKKKYQQL
jgi:AraC-like DNA-binding protein